MFTPGGQIDRLTFMGLRGGGKGGGGGGGTSKTMWDETTLVDPATGEAYTSSPWSMYTGGKSAAQQLNDAIRARQDKATTDAATAKQAADAKAAADEATFLGRKSSAYDTALQDAIRAFSNQGVDPNTYRSNYIDPALSRIGQGIQDLDPNPMGAYPESLGQQIVNQALSDRRTGLTNQFNSIFTPNYATSALPDTTTGQYVDTILGEQFDPLKQQLINAQKRGTLTQPGYDAALARLNQKMSAARDTVSNLGANILATDRSGLNDLISGGRSDINALTLGGNLNPQDYVTRANDLVTRDLANFGGALRNAVGNSQFADLSDLINAGGAVQGANNPTANNPVGGTPGETPDEILANKKRGLGNTGAF